MVTQHNQRIDKILEALKESNPLAFNLLTGDENFENLERMARIENFQDGPSGVKASYFETYIEPDGRAVRLNHNDFTLIDWLRDLSPENRIKIMRLRPLEMEGFVKQKLIDDHARALDLYTKKWCWKMDDGPCNFLNASARDNKYYFGLELTPKEMRRKLKAGKFSYDELDRIIKFFESENREFKYKENGEWVA